MSGAESAARPGAEWQLRHQHQVGGVRRGREGGREGGEGGGDGSRHQWTRRLHQVSGAESAARPGAEWQLRHQHQVGGVRRGREGGREGEEGGGDGSRHQWTCWFH